MRFQGIIRIDAPLQRVWDFLTDPEQVSRCAPGVSQLQILEPGRRFRATTATGFGTIKVKFAAEAEWLDLEAPHRARMKVHGTAPGSAMDAESEMLLADLPDGATELTWSADVTVVGQIASLAARLMKTVTKKLTDRFFDDVRAEIERQASEVPAEFQFGPVSLEEAAGKLLAHNVAGSDGRRLLRKGQALGPDEIAALREMGRQSVYVAVLGVGDVDEEEAALRVAHAAAGGALRTIAAGAGRVNLVAEARGVFRIDTEALDRVNRLRGITVATLRQRTFVREGQIAVTVKIVPFAIPASHVETAQLICGAGMARVDPLFEKHVGLVLQGTLPSRERVIADFVTPLSERIERLGSRIAGVEFVTLDDELGEERLAAAIRKHAEIGTDVVIIAGETAIVDERDIAPRAIEAAGGSVCVYGAPVDPGNLLLLAYAGEKTAIVGAPGCARSQKPNVIDLVLPRLLAGERLTANDIAAMGHGGLLADIPERGAPRAEPS